MLSGTVARLADASSATLFVFGDDVSSSPLYTRLRDETRYRLESIDEATAVDGSVSAGVAGVVFLNTVPRESHEWLRSLPEDVPRIVVGTTVDPAAAYAGGASDVIPLAVESHLGTVVSQITRVLDRAHERRLTRDLVNEANEGIIVHEPDTGEIVTCNEQLYRMLGHDPAATDLTLADLVGRGEGITEQRATDLIQRAAAGTPQRFTWQDPTNDSGTLWVEVKLRTATLDGSRYVVSSARPLTERQAETEQLRANQAALERMQEITADPSQALTTQIQQLLDFGTEYLGMDIGFLSRIDEASDGFEIIEAVGDHPLIQAGNESDLTETYCRHALGDDADLPLVVDDAAEEMAGDPAYEKFGLGCYLGAKLVVDGELYGTLCFADTEPRTDPITEMEQTVLDYMSQWLRQELERRAYVEEVETARRRNQRLLERIDDAFFGLDEDWRVQYVNDAGGDVLRAAMNADYDNETMVGKHCWEVIPDAVGTTFYDEYHRAMADQTAVTFEEYYEPLGVWLEVRAYPDEHGLSVFFSDVTERKQREEELYILERAMQKASVSLAMSDPTQEGNPLVFVNDAFEELTGYPAETALGANCRFLQGPETDPETVAEIRAAVDAEEPISTEILNYRRDGTEFWNRLYITPIYDEDGTLLRYLASQYDITEEYRTRTIRRRLLSTTQRLMDASSREEIAEIVANAAVNILGHEPTVVYLRDHGGEQPLVPVAWPDQIDEVFGGPPEYQDGGPLLNAFEAGEPVVVDDIAAHPEIDAERFQPVESLLLIPLGDHGVLGVGGYETGTFDTAAIERARLLTVNATSAFSRMDRRQELEQYETLFETVQERRYVIDADGYIELASEPLAETVGYTADELEGKHISTITTADTEARRWGLESDLLETPEAVSSSYEGTLLDREGNETAVEIEVSLLPHDEQFRGAVGAVRDITERRKREAELRVIQQAITEAGIGLTIYDQQGRFEYVNDHYAQLVGRRREALESAPIWETFSDLTPERFETYWDSFAPNETRTEQTEHSRPDQSTVPVETVTTAVDIDGTRHNLMLVKETTGRRERRQQTEVLHRIMRHNLRNDLTVVLGRVKLLVEALEGQQATHAEIIEENATDLLDTVEAASDARDVVDHDIVRKPIDVAALLRELLAEISEEASFGGTIETALPKRQPVLADFPLERGLRQLLTNAIEHNDAADPSLSVRVHEADGRPGWVAIEIQDNGPGIPPEEISVLTAGEETALHHGSGIGLWVIHWVVTRYGGDLEFEVPPDGGSLVRIKLPAAES